MAGSLAFGCDRLGLVSKLEGLDKKVKLVKIVCFILGLSVASRGNYELVRAAYNPRTGAVWFRRTPYTFVRYEGYEPGNTFVMTYESGGRRCASALMGYGNPYDTLLCLGGRRLQ